MININDEFSKVTKYFSPLIIGELNGQYIKIAKIKGDDIPWHSHEKEDELFFIIDGILLMEIENREPFNMHKGDMFIVEKNTLHRVSSEEECMIMLFEPKSTEHTGSVKSMITKSIEEQRY